MVLKKMKPGHVYAGEGGVIELRDAKGNMICWFKGGDEIKYPGRKPSTFPKRVARVGN